MGTNAYKSDVVKMKIVSNANSGAAGRNHGFTLLETLLVVGLLGLLVALLLPVLSAARANARASKSTANIRQIGQTLSMYAAENKDSPPVLYFPKEIYYPPGTPETVTVNGRTIRGLWFYTATDFHVAFSPPIPAEVLLAPASTNASIDVVDGVGTVRVPDYRLADCLYAEPQYWDRYTQLGASQWHAQRFANIAFPSSKGLIRQTTVYGLPNRPRGQQTAFFTGVLSSVLWSDQSASTVDQSGLPPGVPNFYYHSNGAPLSYADVGAAIDQTQDGIRGRDRVGQ